MPLHNVIELILNGGLGAGILTMFWHIDRRLIRLETAAGLGAQAEKE